MSASTVTKRNKRREKVKTSIPREDVGNFTGTSDPVPGLAVHEHRGEKSGLDFLVIGICRFSLHFDGGNLAVKDRFDELSYVVCLTLISEDYGGMTSAGIRSFIYLIGCNQKRIARERGG